MKNFYVLLLAHFCLVIAPVLGGGSKATLQQRPWGLASVATTRGGAAAAVRIPSTSNAIEGFFRALVGLVRGFIGRGSREQASSGDDDDIDGNKNESGVGMQKTTSSGVPKDKLPGKEFEFNTFFEQQKKRAEERRRQYREQAGDLKATASVLVNPIRTVKWTVVALAIAELFDWIDGESVVEELSDLALVAVDDVAFQLENFWTEGRRPGGLLRVATWTQRKKLSLAIQRQINAKYQWAIGAAIGLVTSPVIWSLGWKGLAWFAGLWVVSEAHNFAKFQSADYYYFLKETNSTIIYAVDDTLEDVRELVENASKNPLATLFAIRTGVEDRLDYEFPPMLQTGLVMGAIFGVMAGA